MKTEACGLEEVCPSLSIELEVELGILTHVCLASLSSQSFT